MNSFQSSLCATPERFVPGLLNGGQQVRCMAQQNLPVPGPGRVDDITTKAYQATIIGWYRTSGPRLTLPTNFGASARGCLFFGLPRKGSCIDRSPRRSVELNRQNHGHQLWFLGKKANKSLPHCQPSRVARGRLRCAAPPLLVLILSKTLRSIVPVGVSGILTGQRFPRRVHKLGLSSRKRTKTQLSTQAAAAWVI